ncbi:MAG: phosphate signaling complex protein PhoU, partial [Chromatiales bacterium]
MEKDLHLSQHISQRFNAELEEIRNRVMKMGGLVEKQISRGMKALLTSDTEYGELVTSSDYEINALEVDIDEECMQILARRQPAASDLRLIVTIIKTITDLERIGDEAEKLGRYSVLLADENTTPGHFVELGHLGHHVKRMLRDALDAFARLDAEAALRTIADDELVNEEFDAISRQLITRMMEDPREIKNALRISWCARALER